MKPALPSLCASADHFSLRGKFSPGACLKCIIPLLKSVIYSYGILKRYGINLCGRSFDSAQEDPEYKKKISRAFSRC